MKTLPIPARLYVGGVIGLGVALLVFFFPLQAFSDPGRLSLFVLLLFLSAITSTFKVNLPLTRSGSTMSVSYAVDFASLLLLGPNETMIVAAASAYSQCTFRIKERNPLHRTLFSMACLVITVQAAGAAYHLLGGVAGPVSMLRRCRSRSSARRRPTSWSTRWRSPRRSRFRPTRRSSRSGTRTSCGARRATSSAPARPPSPRGWSRAGRRTGSRRSRRRRSI